MSKERRFTPETDPELPVKIAVRMSMGIPGVFEPFAYQGHLYCDGGMINDFPMNALPEGPGRRLGLCVKQKEFVSYHMGPIEGIVGAAELAQAPHVRTELLGKQDRLWRTGVYPTRDMTDLATTVINVSREPVRTRCGGSLWRMRTAATTRVMTCTGHRARSSATTTRAGPRKPIV